MLSKSASSAFVDAQYLWDKSLKFYGRKIDYRALRDFLLEDSAYGLVRVYLIVDPIRDSTEFLNFLARTNYLPRIKVCYRDEECRIANGNWLDEMIKEIETEQGANMVTILSGNAAFVSVINLLKRKGKSVELVCFRQAVSPVLLSAACTVRYLDESIESLLLPAPKKC